MRKISLALAFVASLLALPAQAANFSAKDASAATIIFTNPGNCTTGCTPIFAWSDSTGANLVAVLTAGADGASNTANGGLTYSRNMVFNGTTWDRWLGDATNGGFVNVKTSVLPTGAATSALQSSAAAAKGEGATGAAVPSGAQYVGINVAGNLTGWTAKAGNTYAGTDVVPGVAVVNSNANGQAAMAASSPVVIASNQSAVPSSIDPCNDALTVKSFLPITATTSLVKVIATGTAAKKLYICQINLVTTAANNVAVFEATTATTCATAAVAVYGAGTSVATAANGYPFAANGGISLGNGLGTVGATTVNNNDLCIGTSAATPLTGGIIYATK